MADSLLVIVPVGSAGKPAEMQRKMHAPYFETTSDAAFIHIVALSYFFDGNASVDNIAYDRFTYAVPVYSFHVFVLLRMPWLA
jgi:hypothetical protein